MPFQPSLLSLLMALSCIPGATCSTAAQTLADALDATNLVWTTGGDAVWFAQTTNTYDGVDAARSGRIYSNQTSWLETTVVGPATISFWSFTHWPPSGFTSFTWRFTVSGTESSAGIVMVVPPWSQQTYDLGEGTNVLHWTAVGTAAGAEEGFVCLDEFAILPPRPLAIVIEPMDSTVYSGAQAWLTASVVGTPPFEYQWFKGGTNLLNATNNWFHIEQCATNDSGTYSVVVSNSQGSVISSNAVLTVLPPSAPFFTYEPESTIVYTGQSFDWWAGVDGSPPFIYQWRKDGTNLPGGTGNFLILNNISPADAGSYTLYVTNNYGSIETSNAVLTVIASVAPAIMHQPRSLDVAEGVNTWMSVSATGLPDPWYIWTKEGSPPAPSDPFPPFPISISNPQHPFNQVTTNDAGIYFVTVTNYAGAVASRQALLTVLPAITNVGSWNLDAEDIFVTNGLAFLARGTNGLAILDVSNPASPQLLGSCGTSGYALAVRASGNLAFVAEESAGLQIINVSNPSHPILAGSYHTTGSVFDIAVRSNLVFVADGNAGLLILNVSNPASPSVVGSYSTNLSPNRICLSGNRAYLAAGTPAIGPDSNTWVSGVLIMDISNPAQPAELGRFGSGTGALAARDQLIFALGDSGGLTVIDTSNPAQPSAIGAFDYYPDPSTNFPPWIWISAHDIRVVNDLAYLVGYSGDETHLFVLDVRNPNEPVPVGYFATPGHGYSLWVDGRYVYVAGYDSPLQIIETPFDPQPAGPPALSLSQENGLKLHLQGWRGLNYTIEYADGLSGFPWQPLQTVLLTNNNATIQAPSGPPTRFFRLKQLD